MNENEVIAAAICGQLAGGSPLVLVSIVSFQGSIPRRGGTKMVVGVDGKSYGTIGGSLLEASAIGESRAVLAAAQSRMMDYELTGRDASAAGMICGGKATLLLDYIPATPENKEFFSGWHEAIRRGRDFYLLTHLKGTGNMLETLGHSIFYRDGRVVGNVRLEKDDIGNLRSDLHNISSISVVSIRDTRVVIDAIRRLKTLYCFGAGHVALSTAHLAALVGFRVVVVDDRSDFANAERFPDADRIRVIDDFNRALEELEIDADSFIVIVTRGHQYDRAVLEQALKTPAGYIGMISSRRKREAIYEALMAKGVTKEALERVHSPIGIAIGGETPEEIAVSIVAELISERSQQLA
jgi:xanthine dehydrogenase accessory factor